MSGFSACSGPKDDGRIDRLSLRHRLPGADSGISPSGLFSDDYAQPDAVDGEPVFWSVNGGQAFPDDDFIQPDLSAGSTQADAPDCAD